MGRSSFQSALRILKKLKYIERSQGAPCEYASEVVNLSKAPPSQRDGFEFLAENLLDLQWADQALLDYLLSHAPTFAIPADMIAQRFHVSTKTIRRTLERLSEMDLAEVLVDRDDRGRFLRKGFVAVRNRSHHVDKNDPRDQEFVHVDIYRPRPHRPRSSNPHKIDQGFNEDYSSNRNETSFADTTLRERNFAERDGPLRSGVEEGHARSKKAGAADAAREPAAASSSSSRRGSAGASAAAASEENRGAGTTFAKSKPHAKEGKTLRRPKGGNTNLRDGSDDDRLLESLLEPSGVDDNIEGLNQFDNKPLCAALKRATDGRIGRKLLSEDGLFAVRKLIAAHAYYQNVDITNESEAREAVLDFLRAFIAPKFFQQGSDGPWLNSWRLISKRMAGERYGGSAGLYDDFEEPSSPSGDEVPF